NDHGHAWSQAKLVDHWWEGVVVKTTAVIPVDEDCCVVPVGRVLHYRIYQTNRPVFTLAYAPRGMLACGVIRDHPTYRRQVTAGGIQSELRLQIDVVIPFGRVV